MSLKLCKDCARFVVRVKPRCEWKDEGDDPVYGGERKTIVEYSSLAWDMRRPGGECGPEARMFIAKEPK